MTMDYFFSADAEKLDRPQIHQWLSEQSYWAEGRSREKQDAAIDGSRNYGAYDSRTDQQVAYARVVTDGTTFAWLCDVFVSTEVRGLGIGKMLTAGVVEDLEPLELKRILLSTCDAHELYRQYGFAELNEPSTMMARVLR